MKLKRLILFVVLFGATALSIPAQPIWLGGPANPITNTIAFAPGWSLIANPLFHFRGEFVSNAVPDNSVGELFSGVPNGTVLLKFDNATHRFAPRNVFRHGRWSKPSQTLASGEGAYFFNPQRGSLEIAFSGNWSYGTVSVSSGMSLISSPGPGTIDFTAQQTSDAGVPPGPFASTGIRFNPQEGDIVYTLASDRGAFVSYQFHNAAWDTLPVLNEGESCFVFTSHPRLIQYTGSLPLRPD